MQELIDALAIGPGGVQINVTEAGVTVSTRYRPTITARGNSIEEAVFAVAKKAYKYAYHPEVVQALEEYDERVTVRRL